MTTLQEVHVGTQGADTALGADTHIVALVRRLSYASTIEDVMGMVTMTARLVLQADGITFVLREGDLCHYAEEDAISPLWRGQRFPMGMCISGWVMSNSRSVFIEDIYGDPRIPHDAYQATFVRSLAMAPVRKDDPLAALGAYWRARRTVSAEELGVLEKIADAAALAIDNLELRRARETLQRLQDAAERADGARAGFLGALSHALHQPLQSLYFLAGALEQRVCETPVRTVVGHLDDELASLRSLLGDLRVLSRFEGGAAELTDVRVADVLDAVAVAHGPAATEKGIRLSVEANGAVVRSEPTLLTRMLGSLLESALRHTDGGEVRIECCEEGNRLRISVEGNGISVPSDSLDLVAGLTGTGDAACGRRHPIAIRLAIIQRLGAVLGHEVEASTHSGQGSRFTIIVPRSV